MKNCFLPITFVISLLVTGCQKQQFFEDPNNPGLSRLTNRDYDVTSAYINGQPWVSGFSNLSGAFPMFVQLKTGTALKDTLYISWQGSFTNTAVFPSASWRDYSCLSVCIPVAKNFSAADFLRWNGKSFATDTVPVSIVLSYSQPWLGNPSLSGKGNIYFIKVGAESDSQGKTEFKTSGLIEGNIGDSILIKKGRFDYEVLPANYNLP